MGTPKTAPRTLQGLIDLLNDPHTRLVDIEKNFGPLVPSKHSLNGEDLGQPLKNTKTVTIGHRKAQNLDFVTTLDVRFEPGAEPNLASLARALGTPKARNEKIRSGCSHRACPTVIGFRGPVLMSQRLVYRLVAAAGTSLGKAQAARFGVESLYVDGVGSGCRKGGPVAQPTPLNSATDSRSAPLAVAVQRVAELLKADPYDASAIRGQLSPFGKVMVRDNKLSGITWVRLTLNDKPIPPTCFDPKAYVREPELLCRITQANRHLYEYEASAKHRIFLIEDLSGAYKKPVDHISYLEFERIPRTRSGLIF